MFVPTGRLKTMVGTGLKSVRIWQRAEAGVVGRAARTMAINLLKTPGSGNQHFGFFFFFMLLSDVSKAKAARIK